MVPPAQRAQVTANSNTRYSAFQTYLRFWAAEQESPPRHVAAGTQLPLCLNDEANYVLAARDAAVSWTLNPTGCPTITSPAVVFSSWTTCKNANTIFPLANVHWKQKLTELQRKATKSFTFVTYRCGVEAAELFVFFCYYNADEARDTSCRAGVASSMRQSDWATWLQRQTGAQYANEEATVLPSAPLGFSPTQPLLLGQTITWAHARAGVDTLVRAQWHTTPLHNKTGWLSLT